MKKTINSDIWDSHRFSRKGLLIFTLAMIPVGLFLLVTRAAPPSPPTVYLTPETRSVPANTEVVFEVRSNSGTTPVNAVQANVSYNTTLFDFVSFDSSTSSYGIQAQAVATGGVIYMARGVSGGSSSLTGDHLISKFTLRSKATSGVSSLSFSTGTVLVSSTTNQNIITSLANTGISTLTVDTNAPSVSITAPTNSAVISNGSTVSVVANASDSSSGISKVEVFIDGAIVGTLTNQPYSYSWNTANVALGSHSIYARATDSVGNFTNSPTVNVTIADQTAPSASITAPTANATVSGSVNVNASSTDNMGGLGVNRVEFYVDNVLKGSDSTPPYSYLWDTKTSTDGAHSLTVKTYDNATPSNSRTSSAVSVNVDNADRTPPSAPTNFRMTSNSQTSISLAWNASTDNVGVTGYRLTRDGAVISTSNVTNFVDNGRTAGRSYQYSLVAFDSAGNNSSVVNLTASAKAVKPGDVDGDDDVDIIDLSMMLNAWETNDARSDLNKDGVVNTLDLSILLLNYGK